jgi:NADH-quinone oxidoreductase subunit B
VHSPVVVDVGEDLRVHSLELACCSVEVSEALARLGVRPDADADAAGTGARTHVLLVSGTVTRTSVADVRAAWESLPEPRVAVAFGACTITGGPYWDSYAVLPGLDGIVPAAVHVPGCPPRPQAVHKALEMVRARA